MLYIRRNSNFKGNYADFRCFSCCMQKGLYCPTQAIKNTLVSPTIALFTVMFLHEDECRHNVTLRITTLLLETLTRALNVYESSAGSSSL